MFQFLFERIEQLRLIVGVQDCTGMFGKRNDGGRQSSGLGHLLQFVNQKTMSQMNSIEKADSGYQPFPFQCLRISYNYHFSVLGAYITSTKVHKNCE